jgi:hypothetical protein
MALAFSVLREVGRYRYLLCVFFFQTNNSWSNTLPNKARPEQNHALHESPAQTPDGGPAPPATRGGDEGRLPLDSLLLLPLAPLRSSGSSALAISRKVNLASTYSALPVASTPPVARARARAMDAWPGFTSRS